MTEHDKLPRVLGITDIVLLGISSVIGSGIFLLPGIAAGVMGPAALVPLLCAGLLCVLVALCYAEVGSRFSATGGAYLYAAEAFGPLVGFSVGWMSWWVRMIAWAALANGFALALLPLVGDVPAYFDEVVAVALLLVLTVINFRGARFGAAVLNIFSIGKLIPLVIFIGAGVFFIDVENFTPFAPNGYGSIGETTLVLLWAFVGFEAITVPAGEMRNPSRTIPLAFLIVMGIVTLVYVLVFVVACGTYPNLAGSENPVAEAAGVFLGPAGATLVGVGIVISLLGTNSVSALVTPRSIYALAEQGQAPGILAELHANYRTPAVGLLLSFVITVALALSGSFAELAVISVVARFFQYLPTSLAVLVFRHRDRRHRDRLSGQQSIQSPGGFRMPLGPTIPLLSTALCVLLLTQTEHEKLLAGALAFVLGLPVYFFMGRRSRTS